VITVVRARQNRPEKSGGSAGVTVYSVNMGVICLHREALLPRVEEPFDAVPQAEEQAQDRVDYGFAQLEQPLNLKHTFTSFRFRCSESKQTLI
jgi:hypothetical protein